MLIVRITINALLEKRTEVMQTLLSMIEPTENERGCLSCHAFRDIEDNNGFDLIAEIKNKSPSEGELNMAGRSRKDSAIAYAGAGAAADAASPPTAGAAGAAATGGVPLVAAAAASCPLHSSRITNCLFNRAQI